MAGRPWCWRSGPGLSGTPPVDGPQSSTMSAARPRVESGDPFIAISLATDAPDRFEQAQQLARFTGVRERDDDIVALHRAEVAVHRLRRVRKNAGVPVLDSVAATLRR